MEDIITAPATPTASPPAEAAKASSVAVATPSTSAPNVDNKGASLEFDPSLSEDERRFYMKAYPSIELVRERKVHCTICKCHIGTAPSQESAIKMHPVLRVTQCTKCHDFYNSGEFSKGEDGSELYCRWCGQGGEVYCCSNCPYVFCKSCIVKNLSRGVVADIEQNENWSCFNCAPKILWPLRAQHWALINYIDKQKKTIQSLHISESEMKQQMAKDRSACCRLAKAKCGNMSDSLESIDSVASKRSLGSSSSTKKTHKLSISGIAGQLPAAKRAKTSNDVVVCTPDLMSMLEPDCQITVSNKPRPPQSSPTTSSPKVISIQSSYGTQPSPPVHNTAPPPLVLRNTGIQLRHPSPAPIIRRTVVGPRTPNASGGGSAPVYHTINGYRIDLNSAAQQETFRLPNGKLIQVKRQGTQQSGGVSVGTANMSPNNWQQRTPAPVIQHGARPVQITQASPQSRYITVQHSPSTAPSGPNYAQQQQQTHTQVVRYHNTMVGNTSVTAVGHNGSGTQIQLINGAPQATAAGVPSASTARIAPVMVRHAFPDTAIGQARTQLQEQVFNAMEICQHLTGKVQTLTNSNAYKQARNYLEVKELYIHLSYLLTYAIGRFKGLQDKCLGDMRQLGFVNDADSLENGQLAAGVDYVRYGQLNDVDLFNTGCNSFHNQVYEYRKSLHANLEDGDEAKKQPLSPLMPLGNAGLLNDTEEACDGGEDGEEADWPMQDDSQPGINYDDAQEMNDENDEPEDTFADEEQQDDAEDEDKYYNATSHASAHHSTEDYMSREEEAHAYDRKLTRLIEQYPSIWCTRHHDYGNFEVTRKQWRTIASHFKRTESLNIKIRWKNIRKRFVRIERRVREGKRFNGYFDKATNFLANRDLPMSEWLDIDRGEIDGDIYERKQLDVVEHSLYPGEDKAEVGFAEQLLQLHHDDYRQRSSLKPIEIRPVDLKIINFVKCNPVLWRKTSDPMCNKIDEQSRKSLWMHLWKSMPHLSCGDIIDRWNHLYEMYKTFRLKTIKDENALAHLELKYSKYLAKLYFLYKIDEDDLKKENNIFEDIDGDECMSSSNNDKKLQDMPDDKEFLLELVRTVQSYPMLWNIRHVDYHDVVMREGVWNEIGNKLQEFKHKQASDDEDNEIEIVEPKTDTITLDSDNEDEPPMEMKPMMTATTNVMTTAATTSVMNSNVSTSDMDDMDFRTTAQSILASMLEVDFFEGDPAAALSSPAGSDQMQKKQPRKKTTNKPNPTLIKQKEMLERERLEEMKKNDLKLKMKCAIELKKAEEEYPFAKEMLEEKEAEKQKETEMKSVANGGDEESGEQKEPNETEEERDKDESEEIVVMLVEDDLDSSIEEEKEKLKERNDEVHEDDKQLIQLNEENKVVEKHEEENKKEKMDDQKENKGECKENENKGKIEIEDKSGNAEAITKIEDGAEATTKKEDKEVISKVEDEEAKTEKEDEELIREALGEKESANTSKEDEELIREALEQKDTNAQNQEEEKESEDDDDNVLATVKEANIDIDNETKEKNKTKENNSEVKQINNTESMEVDEPNSTDKLMEVDDDIDKTQVNKMIQLSTRVVEAEDAAFLETTSEKQLATVIETSEETTPTTEKPITQENQINSDESELDVDKEIEKLLQKKNRQTSIEGENNTTNNTEDETKLSATEDFHDVLALGPPSTARRSTTPGLFNDIKELIEKESNSAT